MTITTQILDFQQHRILFPLHSKSVTFIPHIGLVFHAPDNDENINLNDTQVVNARHASI